MVASGPYGNDRCTEGQRDSSRFPRGITGRPAVKPKKIAEQARGDVAAGARELLAHRYHIAVILMAITFGTLALLARTASFFSIDLELTRAIQGASPPWLRGLFESVTWIGFPPQSNVVFGAIVLGFVVIGYHLEAQMTAVAAIGSAGLWYLIAPLVDRPRPSPELVDVAMQLPTASFLSGHVVNLTAIFGFLIYLALLPRAECLDTTDVGRDRAAATHGHWARSDRGRGTLAERRAGRLHVGLRLARAHDPPVPVGAAATPETIRRVRPGPDRAPFVRLSPQHQVRRGAARESGWTCRDSPRRPIAWKADEKQTFWLGVGAPRGIRTLHAQKWAEVKRLRPRART